MAGKLCNVCNKRRVYTGSKGTDAAPHGSDMCNYCYEEGSWENLHSDYGHDASSEEIVEPSGVEEDGKRVKTCWICFPELNLAQKGAKVASGPKVQGTRRPQLNHKGHSHPQTPAARRACKQAFWSALKEHGWKNVPAALEAWNHKCDANGKAVSGKGGWAGVAPLGPKGGVGASMKAAAGQAMSLNLKTGKIK